MGEIVVFPDPPPPELARTLDVGGYHWTAVANAELAAKAEPPDGWACVVVAADTDLDGAWAFCRGLRKKESVSAPLLLLVSGRNLGDLELRDDLFDDFCMTPFHPAEVEARVRHLLWRGGSGAADAREDMVEYTGLVLNLDTYQAAIEGQPLDLTYMEYELLKFLAQNPGKVFTREILLSRVWGYEYYGGARTVDVHIRRLRAKLGEEHANLIQTVRSVGYRFGQTRRLGAGGGS
jgi:two-component system, OmpR family, alkaline phosphatase synthesis response regulator PhoP